MGELNLLPSLIEQGVTNEVEILVSLHNSGIINAVKWISETARNVLDGVLDESMSKKDRLAKAEKLKQLVDVIIDILKAEADEEVVEAYEPVVTADVEPDEEELDTGVTFH